MCVCVMYRRSMRARTQGPEDAACYAYSEANGTFGYWGPDSVLRLTPRAPRGSRASRPPFVRSGGPCGLAWALCACARASACAFVRND